MRRFDDQLPNNSRWNYRIIRDSIARENSAHNAPTLSPPRMHIGARCTFIALCVTTALVDASETYQRCTQASDCSQPAGAGSSTVCSHLFKDDLHSQTVCLYTGHGRPWPPQPGYHSPCYKNTDCENANATCSAIPWSSHSLPPPPQNQCYSDSCSSVADCSRRAAGDKGHRACVASGLNTTHGFLPAASCVTASCTSDSNCGLNGSCAAFFPAYDGYPPSPSFHCYYPGDACKSNGDCKNLPGQPRPFCVWDTALGKPKCEQVVPPPATPTPTKLSTITTLLK